MEPGRAEAALGEILEFLRSVEVRAYGEVAREAFRKAADRGVTVYDAAYAALAEALGGVPITLDGKPVACDNDKTDCLRFTAVN